MSRAKKSPAPENGLAAEIREQGIEKKLERYASAKQHTQGVADYIVNHETSFGKHAKGLSECGSWLVFRHYHTVDKHRLIKANLCKKHLLCSLCAMRRSALQVKSFEPKLSQLMLESPKLVPVLITFTIKNGSDLEERFNHLDTAKKKIVRRRADARNGKKTDTILKHLAGGAGSYEFKRGSGSDEWHPHIHVVALLEPEFELTEVNRKGKLVDVPLEFENKLRSEWLEQTGDSHMVDVRRIRMDNEQDKFGAICEAFKYALKLNELDTADQVAAAEVLQGRRLQFSFGNLHGLKINPGLVDDPEKELALLPYIDLVYRHNNGSYNLSETTDFGNLRRDKTEKEKFEDFSRNSKQKHSKNKWKKAVEDFIQKKESNNDSIQISEKGRRKNNGNSSLVEGREACSYPNDVKGTIGVLRETDGNIQRIPITMY